MKMRKSTWLLLVLALAAILLVAGCSPTTPPNGEEPNGEEPTPPPAGGCPTKVKTVVTSLYCGPGKISPNLSILISFDKDIVLLDNNPANWKVTVDRYVPFMADDDLETYKAALTATVDTVAQMSSKTIRITASVKDSFAGTFSAHTPINKPINKPNATFNGLICTENCYKAFVDVIAGANGALDIDYADEAYSDKVKWEYIGGGFPYSDILGNLCSCDISGEACCVACEACATPEPHCPIGTICY